MPTPDKQLSAEQSRQIAETIREEIARRRISRQSLAEQAKLSLSTLEKVLGGRRPFTLGDHRAAGAGARRVLAQVASGVRACPGQRRCRPRRSRRLFAPRGRADRRDLHHHASVVRRQGRDLRLSHRDRLGRGGIVLLFREGERLDTDFSQFGEVAVPNQSGFIYLVTNRHGQHRVITVSRPTITGEMYGIITTLLAGRGSQLTPIAAPIALLPVQNIANPSVGRVMSGDAEL